MKNRIVSVILALILVLPLCPVHSFAISIPGVLPGSGTAEDPYIIRNAADWNRTTIMHGTHYKLSDDFDNSSSPVTTSASGTLNRVTFDGNGRTLTVNIYDVEGEGTAPFRRLGGDCVIKNLTVRGTVTGAAYASGLVGFSEYSGNSIENCIVDVDVRLPGENDYRFGGVVGNVLSSSELTVTDTAFTGTLYNTCPGYATGGLIGWSNNFSQITLKNCVFSGQYIGEAKEYFHPIAIKGNGSTHGTRFIAENLYYTQSAGLKNNTYIFTNNGTRLYSPSQYGLMRTNIELFGERYSTDENLKVQINVPDTLLYTGEVIDLDAYPPTVSDGTELIRGVDYTLEVSPGTVVEKGYYELTYTGIGEYAGTATAQIFVGSSDYRMIKSDTTSWNGGTYILSGFVTVPERITVTGDVRLHLYDGAILTASKGICVSSGNSLIIEADGDAAELHVNATGGDAGIGGNENEGFGTITIESGRVYAAGAGEAAAIGGSKLGRDGGNIVINGGTVTATGGTYGAAIGSGQTGSFGEIIINGGTVSAQAGWLGAAIGTGSSGDKRGSVTINGGIVTAKTYPESGSHGAAIGSDANSFRFAAVTINGGTVTAESECSAAAIGAGPACSAGGSVTINGGKVTARTSYDFGAAIGAGNTAHANVTIIGGVVEAYGQKYHGAISTGTSSDIDYRITLGWTNPTDSIYASSYKGTVVFAEHKFFMRSDNGDYVTAANIGGAAIVPFTDIPYNVTVNTTEHANVSVDAFQATEGQIVAVTWIAEYPYVAESVFVHGAGGDAAFTRTGPCSGTFCMPAENVTVSVYMSAVRNKTIRTSEGTVVCHPIIAGFTDYDSDWYYVSGEVRIGGRMNIHGDVKIYLCDGALLDCAGITVQSGNSLTIEGTGALKAVSAAGGPGIGGVSSTDCGTILIRGGVIEARGGYLAAGIGSDSNASCGSITILGGTVTAVGGYYATGIGTGAFGKGGSVTILGGQVTARATDGMEPGIGSDNDGDDVDILLGWTNVNDYIDVSGISRNARYAQGQFFTVSNTGEIARTDNVANSRLVPYDGTTYAIDLISPDSAQGIVLGLGVTKYDTDIVSTMAAGAVVKVCIEPVYPYECGELTVTTSSGITVSTTLVKLDTVTGVGTYSFVMPEGNVTVSAVMNRLTPVQRQTPEGTFSFMPMRAYASRTFRESAQGVNIVVDRDIDFATLRIYILDGSAKLYLDAGCTLKCRQIHLDNACTGITIYGEGTLIADASSGATCGIGPHGNITIYGGTIIAKGGTEGAGIGGAGTGANNTAGFDYDSDCTITIHGGSVTAVGGLFAAGIGGGYQQRATSIVIDGGVVNATGGSEGAGIGGGVRGSGGSITVSGGTVTAIGRFRGAGIGGGLLGAGGSITITGGVVNATGGLEAAGIGGGSGSTGGNITISGGVINATGGGSRKTADQSFGFGAGIGGGSKAAGDGANIVITGGQITARGGWQTDRSQSGNPSLHSYGIGHGWKSDVNDTITLGSTNPGDFIDAGGEYCFGGTVVFEEGKNFLFAGTETSVTEENINSAGRIVPDCYVSVEPPTVINGLTWNGEAQELILPGSAAGGTLKYCISANQPNDAAFTTTVPSAAEPGVYTVWYKAFGDENHLDSAAIRLSVKIAKATVDDPTVILSQTGYIYDKTAKTPTVTVKDGEEIIDPSEYTVTYENNINAGSATVTVTAKENGHYIFTSGAAFTVGAEFTIEPQTVTVVGLSVENKLFDDSTVATVTGTPVLNGVLAGDDVTLSDGYAAFDTPNMGTGKTVSFSGYALTGAHACNYALASQPADVTANVTALPVSTGSTVLTTAKYTLLARSFTPQTSDLYRFTGRGDVFAAFFIYDRDTLICENWHGYYIGYFDAAVELEAGKDYMIQLYSGYEEGDVTLTVEQAPLGTVTVDENIAHGAIVDCTEEARMGDRVYVFTEADEGYALNRLVVTTFDGESVEADPYGFVMPGKPVTVSALFGEIRTVDFVCPEGVEIWEFSPRFYANGEFSRPGEGETTAAYGAEIEIELWTDDRQSLAISVATPSGEQLPVTYYREFGVWIARFTMPDQDLSVTLTLRDIADLNRDGGVSITDVTALLNFLAGMHPYIAFFDLDGNGSVSITDVTELLNILAGN